MSRSFECPIWAVIGVLLVGSCVIGWQMWNLASDQTFLSTSSPNNTYLVNVKGNPGRPLLIANEVRVDVYKAGRIFLSGIWLHSTGDSFDLSFEAGFPNHRWLSETVVEFYRKEYFDWGADGIEVRNESKYPIKYLRVQSLNKFLVFDLPEGTSISLEVPAARGDKQWLALEGRFVDDRHIPFNSRSFDRQKTQRERRLYRIVITDAGSVIESQ